MTIRTVTFDNGPDIPSEGLLRYIEGNKIGFVDEQGEIKIRASYTFSFPFQDSLALVCNNCIEEQIGEHFIRAGGTWGYIDKTGNEIVPIKYSQKEAKEIISKLRNQQDK